MANNIEKAAKAVEQMNAYFSGENGEVLQEEKLWKNTYIYHQIEKRKDGHVFTINEHIRGMVYSMLSSGNSWDRVAKEIDLNTGMIIPVESVFKKYEEYDPEALKNSDPKDLCNALTEKHCNGRFTEKQMEGLLLNIKKLQDIDKEYGRIDYFYNEIIRADGFGLKKLIKTLSAPGSKNKMVQLGEALTAEYLRNVGYDLAKPDTHICRILGSERLACSASETVPVFEAIDIIGEIAKVLNKQSAEVDYILWSYCADGYGEICTKQPKCSVCKVSEYCMKGR